jgi:hypothetical protein
MDSCNGPSAGDATGKTAATTDIADTRFSSPSKTVSFNAESMPNRPLHRKPTPFNQELSAEIRKSGLGAVFPDEGRTNEPEAEEEGGNAEKDAANSDSSTAGGLSAKEVTRKGRPPLAKSSPPSN